MRVLIVGGTGLISTSITRQLLARGDDVTLFNRGQRPARLPPGARAIVGDRTATAAFEASMAAAGPFDSVIDMIGYQPAEAESAVRAFRGRTGQYLFCSTVDVYRKPATRYPYREEEPHGGLGAYAVAKVACEAILTAAHARGDLPVTIIRPAHTYGEGGRFVGLFGRETRYIDRLRKGKPIISHGDGSSLWASGYTDDVAAAFAAAAGAAHTLGRAYHVTSDEWLTWDQYHRAIAAAVGAPPPRMVHVPTDVLGAVAPRRAAVVVENFQFNNIFDLTAARTDLGFAPAVPLAEGARRTVAWLDAHDLIENSDAFPFEDRLIAAWQRHGAAMARACAGLED
jgi:nucleoside-diphosphate-sugar epimerase